MSGTSLLIKKACTILSGRQSLTNANSEYTEVEFRIGDFDADGYRSHINKDKWDALFETFFVNKKAAHTLSVVHIFKERLRANILKSMGYSPYNVKKGIKNGKVIEFPDKNSLSRIKVLKTYSTTKNDVVMSSKLKGFWNFLDVENVKEVEKKLKIINDAYSDTKDKMTYSIKQNIKNYTADNMRLSHNLEKDIPEDVLKWHKHNMDFFYHVRYFRLKNRFSRSIEGWLRLDFTISKIYELGTNEANDDYALLEYSDSEHSVELEIIEWNDQLMSEEERKRRVSILKKVIFQIRSVNFSAHFIFNLQPWNPISLKKEDLYSLKMGNYTLTDKADGIRCHMITYGDLINFINPITKLHLFKPINNTTNMPLAVFDGEYIPEINRFLIFDVLIDADRKNNKYCNDLRSLNLYNRLKRTLFYKPHFEGLKNVIDIRVKRFYNLRSHIGNKEDIFEAAAKIWENRDTIFDYKLDGLIFTPLFSKYNDSFNNYKLLKWKPDITIDVRIEFDNATKSTLFHCNNNQDRYWGYMRNLQWFKNRLPEDSLQELNDAKIFENKNIKYNRMIIRDEDLIDNIEHDQFKLGKIVKKVNPKSGFEEKMIILGHEGPPVMLENRLIIPKYDIVEYSYNIPNKKWIPLRFRTLDKPNPNSYWTIMDNINCMLHNATIEDFKSNIGDLQANNLRELYDQQNLLGGQKRNIWRKYNNFVKAEMFRYATKECHNNSKDLTHFHLELACGRFGDLDKWLNNKYTHILAIDKSIQNIEEGINRMEKKGFKPFVYKNKYALYWWKKNSSNQKIKIWPVFGDCSGSILQNRIHDKKVLNPNNDPILDEIIFDQKKRLYDFYITYIKPRKMDGFNTVSANFSLHYFLGTTAVSEDNNNILEPWLVAKKKVVNDFFASIKAMLHPTGVFFGTYIDGSKLNQNTEVWKTEEDDNVIYSYEKIHQNTNPSQSEINPLEWDDTFEKADSMIVYNEAWGQKASEPVITRGDIDKIVNSLEMADCINPLANASFSDFYDKWMVHGRKRTNQITSTDRYNIFKRNDETRVQFLKRLGEMRDEYLLNNFSLNKTIKSLVNINATFAFKSFKNEKSLNLNYKGNKLENYFVKAGMLNDD